MIYTINSGYRDIVPELLEKYFNRDKMISYIERIVQHIDEISVNAPKTALECTNVVLSSLENEFDKVLKSPHWVEYARKQGYTVEKTHDIIELFQMKRKSLEKNSDYSDIRQQKLN